MELTRKSWLCEGKMSSLQEKQKKLMPRVRLELTTFRLWDWRAAYCANEAWSTWGKCSLWHWGHTPPHLICKAQLKFLCPSPHLYYVCFLCVSTHLCVCVFVSCVSLCNAACLLCHLARLTVTFPHSCIPSQPEEYDALQRTRSHTHTPL